MIVHAQRAASVALLALSLTVTRVGAQVAGAPADSVAPTFASGALHGDSSAAKRTEFHWFARGLVAGTLTGPLGTWWAVKRAGRSSADAANEGVQLASSDPACQQGFQQGYTRRLRTERKEYAFMGGALGTALFTYAIIRIAKLDDHASSNGQQGSGDPPLIRIPFSFPAPLR